MRKLIASLAVAGAVAAPVIATVGSATSAEASGVTHHYVIPGGFAQTFTFNGPGPVSYSSTLIATAHS